MGLRLPLTSHWLQLCHVASARTKVARKVAVCAFPASTVEADESKEGWSGHELRKYVLGLSKSLLLLQT